MPICLLSAQLALSILIQSGIQPREWCYPQWVGFLLLVFLLTSLLFTLCPPTPPQLSNKYTCGDNFFLINAQPLLGLFRTSFY